MQLLDMLKQQIKQPRVAAILGVILGLILGLTIGWGLWPVEYTDAVPKALSQQYQEEYLRMAIDSYGAKPDADQAARRWNDLGENAVPLLLAVSQDPRSQDIGAILGFKAAVESRIGSITNPVQPTQPAAEAPSSGFKLNSILLIVAIVVILLGVFLATGYFYFLRPLLKGRIKSTGEVSAAQEGQKITKSVAKTDYVQQGRGKPAAQNLTTFKAGDKLYDESFSIDLPTGEYMGQYGVSIADFIEIGGSQKVSAIEVWLFERGEYQKSENKNCTRILMSPDAFKDARSRQRLESKGELVNVEPNGQIVLETGKLQLLAKVIDVKYEEGNVPENRYFDHLTLELAVWPTQQQ